MQKVAPHHEEPLLGGNAHSARYGETIHDGSGKPETVDHQEEVYSENFVVGIDAAESVDKVKEQVRSRQKRMSNVVESGEEHSIIWGMFMAATLNVATFMGKNFSTIQSFVKNFEDLTLKQMFDVTAQLVNDQEEIHGLDKILWEKNSWKRLSLIGDETVINPNWDCLFVHRQKGLFLSVYVDDITLAGKKQNIDPMWKILIKEVDLGEPTSFLDHVYLGCTQRQSEISKDIVDN